LTAKAQRAGCSITTMIKVEAAPFDLPEPLHGLQQAYVAMAGSPGLNFEVDLDPSLPPWPTATS
jgi:hypothetical protein